MKTTTYILITLAIAATAASLSYRCGKGQISPVETKVDTLFVHDTITQIKPVPVVSRVIDTEWVACLVDSSEVVHDTLLVPVPISEKIYQDSTYRAVVSGYRASLDEIEVYPTTKIITKEVTKTISVASRKRWGVGVQAGYGIGSGGLSPYVGVGLSYDVIRF